MEKNIGLSILLSQFPQSAKTQLNKSTQDRVSLQKPLNNIKMKFIFLFLILPFFAFGQECDFVSLYLATDQESSYGQVDSVGFRAYHGGRIVFEKRQWAQVYNLSDFAYHMNKRDEIDAQVDVGITHRRNIFITVKFGNFDCVVRRAILYLNDEKNITPYTPNWD